MGFPRGVTVEKEVAGRPAQVTGQSTPRLVRHAGMAALTAGDDPGAFVVTAKANGIDSSVQVRVAKVSEPGLGPGPTPTGKSVIRWSGTVPPQKWMNFYTKVVSKHASNPELRLTVSFEVPVSDEEVSTRERETRAALRELGLDEESTTP